MKGDWFATRPNHGGLLIFAENRAASAEMNGFLIMTAAFPAD
jgi:hypothetical protein